MSKKMKLIIAGSRTISNNKNNLKGLTKVIKELNWDIETIFCGKAEGADSLGEAYAIANNIPIQYFPARWNDLSVKPCKIRYTKWGKAYNLLAGYNRNEEMAMWADALIVIHQNTGGSLHMLEIAKKYNLLIKEIIV